LQATHLVTPGSHAQNGHGHCIPPV
jgi:hypothetical protein